jgi:hypothetical protein
VAVLTLLPAVPTLLPAVPTLLPAVPTLLPEDKEPAEEAEEAPPSLAVNWLTLAVVFSMRSRNAESCETVNDEELGFSCAAFNGRVISLMAPTVSLTDC